MRHDFPRPRHIAASARSVSSFTDSRRSARQPTRRRTANSRMRLHATHFSSPNTQRGVMGIVAALTLSSAILFMVLALDSGRLYWEGQELQRLADLAALDAATANPDIFNGVTLAGADANPLQSAAEASAVLNGAANLNVPISGVKAYQGSIALNDSIRDFTEIGGVGSSSFNDAVKVRVTKDVCGSVVASLSTLIPGGDYKEPTRDCLTPGFPMTREAVARRLIFVSFQAGTNLLNLCSDSSPILQAVLGKLLNSSACATLIGASGILDERISLLELSNGISTLGLSSSVGTLDGLLDADLSVAQLLDAALYALDRSSPNDIALLNAFEAIANLDIPNLNLLSNMLLIQTPTEKDDEDNVLDTEISLGELLNTAVLLANQCTNPDANNQCSVADGAIVIPSTGLSAGGLLNISQLKLSIIKPPVIAIGPAGCLDGLPPAATEPGCPLPRRWRTEATPAQIAVEAGLNANLAGLLKLDLSLKLSGVDGRAGISKVSRLSNGAGYNVSVGGYTSLISPSATDPSQNALKARIELLPITSPLLDLVSGLLNALLGGLLGDTVVGAKLPPLDLTAQLSLQTGSGGATIPWNDETTVIISGGLDIANIVSGLLNTTTISGLPLTPRVKTCVIFCGPEHDGTPQTLAKLLPGLNGLLNSLLTPVNQLLQPLLESLGVSVTPMQVEILDIQAGPPQLVI